MWKAYSHNQFLVLYIFTFKKEKCDICILISSRCKWKQTNPQIKPEDKLTAGFIKINKKYRNNLPFLKSEVRYFHYSCNPDWYIALLSFQGQLCFGCSLCHVWKSAMKTLEKSFVIQNNSVNVETRLQELNSTPANVKEKKT